MPKRYFLKAIGSSEPQLSEHWLEERTDLLRQVRSPKVPRAIGAGDRLVYYATGHQKLVGIARATHAGSESPMDASPGWEGLPWVLSVQVQLAIPTLKLAPSWSVLEIPSASMRQQSYIEITADQYALAWEAITKATRP